MRPEVASFSRCGFGRATRPRTWARGRPVLDGSPVFPHAAHPFDPSVLDAGAARTDSHLGTEYTSRPEGSDA
jgi:hypothetical protein